MKRIIAFTAALVLAASLLGLSACRHDGGKEDAKTSDAPVTTQTADGQSTVKADTVIYAAGMRAQRDAAIALSQCAPEFIMLGDCQTPKNIIAATQPAHTAAMLIGTR